MQCQNIIKKLSLGKFYTYKLYKMQLRNTSWNMIVVALHRLTYQNYSAATCILKYLLKRNFYINALIIVMTFVLDFIRINLWDVVTCEMKNVCTKHHLVFATQTYVHASITNYRYSMWPIIIHLTEARHFRGGSTARYYAQRYASGPRTSERNKALRYGRCRGKGKRRGCLHRSRNSS